MLIKIDENLPPALGEFLRGLGHDVMTVYEQGTRSFPDTEVIEACRGEGRVLISLDLDFSNIVQFPPEQYPGLVVLRLHKPGPKAVMAVVRKLIPHLETEGCSRKAVDRR